MASDASAPPFEPNDQPGEGPVYPVYMLQQEGTNELSREQSGQQPGVQIAGALEYPHRQDIPIAHREGVPNIIDYEFLNKRSLLTGSMTFAIGHGIICGIILCGLLWGNGSDPDNAAPCKEHWEKCDFIHPWKICDPYLLSWLIVTFLLSCGACPLPACLHAANHGRVLMIPLAFSQIITLFGVLSLVYKYDSCYANDSKPYEFVATMVALRIFVDLLTIIISIIAYNTKYYCEPEKPEEQNRRPQRHSSRQRNVRINVAPVSRPVIQNRCYVCYNEILPEQPVTKQKCGHELHEKCHTEWFAKQYRCPDPTCRG
jgi:hypothetical protein